MPPGARALRSAPETEIVFVGHARVNDSDLQELVRVVSLSDVTTIENETVPAGSEGTVVAVWQAGDLVDVDFDRAGGPATVRVDCIRRS